MIGHDVLTYICARAVGLPGVRVDITPYSYQAHDPGPYNPIYRLEMREGTDSAVHAEDPCFDENDYYRGFVPYRPPERGRAGTLEVLSLYSSEPDWGMDAGLRLSPLQRLMGGSQGYRHLRYGLFFFRAGTAHRRTGHFTRLARVASSRGDRYWALRFSARALHYLQDLLSPFHTKPFPEWYLLSLLAAPFRPQGNLKKLYFITYNYHLNVERYVGYQLWHGKDSYLRCIEDSEEAEITGLRRDILRASRRARRLVYPLFRECRRMWGESMGEEMVKISLRDIEKTSRNRELDNLVCRWLSLSASLVKGYIRSFVFPLLHQREEQGDAARTPGARR